VAPIPPARHLLRARDLADRRFAEQLTVADMARAAHLSPAHFSRELRRAFGESRHQYLLTGRLERRPYGIDVGLRDPSGNSLRLTQVYEDFG